jgi:hypothetical protein
MSGDVLLKKTVGNSSEDVIREKECLPFNFCKHGGRKGGTEREE